MQRICGRLYVNVVLDRSYQSELGRQGKIAEDQLRYQFHVFNKSAASHGFNANTVGWLFGGKEFLPASMLLFPLQQFTFGLTEFYYWDRFVYSFGFSFGEWTRFLGSP